MTGCGERSSFLVLPGALPLAPEWVFYLYPERIYCMIFDHALNLKIMLFTEKPFLVVVWLSPRTHL